MKNKISETNLFDNFKIKKAPKAKKIVNYFDNFKDLYKFEKEYTFSENDNNLVGFSYVDLLKRGFNIFNDNVDLHYGYYNGNSKLNVEFQKAQENYNYLKDAINELDQQQDIKQDQDQETNQETNQETKQETKQEVNNDPK